MNDIEDIKQRIDIIELIGGYVQLTPGGANHKGKCPFHNEKTPSFMVSREKGIWHCFGCGKGGDIFSFMQEIEGMEFREALQFLAQKAGVELRREGAREDRSKRERSLAINTLAARVYHQLLLDHEKAAAARNYLAQRGVSEPVIATFQLGYAPESWEGVRQFLQTKGFSEEEIFRAGLTVKRERQAGSYDRFRNRIMFPVRDHLGRVVGFGGRALTDAQEPKYVNTPQTELYNKSALLYGLDRAKGAIKEQGNAVIVEGYMDVLASHQAGVANVVASSGTALTRDQLQLLARYTEKIALAFDMDVAGESASRRGIDLAWEQGFDVRVVVLPFGKDPDELIRKDAAAWRTAVHDARPYMDYAFERVREREQLFSVEGKKGAAKRLLPLIARLSDPIEQTHYLQKLSRLINVPEEVLRSAIKRQRTAASQPRAVAEKENVQHKSREQRVAEQLLALATAYPEHLEYLIDHLEPSSLAPTNLLGLYKSLITYYTENHQLDHRAFLQAAGREDPQLAHLANVIFLFGTSDLLPQDSVARRQIVREGIIVLKRSALQHELERLRQQLEEAEQHHRSAEIASLAEQVQSATKQLAELQ